MRKATIGFRKGTTAHQDHNRRKEKVVEKEKHIDPNGHYEIWKHEPVREAYKRIFGEAVRKYNEKQKRKDRKIQDYYNQIKKDKKKNTLYEVVLGVYSKDVDNNTKKQIIKQYVNTWAERNPNLEMVGAYYHEDEEGQPHCHIDFIPIGHGYKKGMETQNGLNRAFEEMGITGIYSNMPTEQWQNREREYIEELSREKDIEIIHQKNEKREHLETEEYKLQQEIKKLKERLIGLKTIEKANNAQQKKKIMPAMMSSTEYNKLMELVSKIDETLETMTDKQKEVDDYCERKINETEQIIRQKEYEYESKSLDREIERIGQKQKIEELTNELEQIYKQYPMLKPKQQEKKKNRQYDDYERF